jgi:hypothetical protein
MNQTVRRVVYSASEKAFGIGTIERTMESGTETMQSRFVLGDEIMFRTLSVFDLHPEELVESAIKAEIPVGKNGLEGEQSRDVFVVGTSFLEPLSDTSTNGRILVFEVTKSRELSLLAEHNIKGGCRALAMMDDKIVAALVKTVSPDLFHAISVDAYPRLSVAKRWLSSRSIRSPWAVSSWKGQLATGHQPFRSILQSRGTSSQLRIL